MQDPYVNSTQIVPLQERQNSLHVRSRDWNQSCIAHPAKIDSIPHTRARGVLSKTMPPYRGYFTGDTRFFVGSHNLDAGRLRRNDGRSGGWLVLDAYLSLDVVEIEYGYVVFNHDRRIHKASYKTSSANAHKSGSHSTAYSTERETAPRGPA